MINFQKAGKRALDIVLMLLTKKYTQANLPIDNEKMRSAVRGLIENEHFGEIWLLELNRKSIGLVILTLGWSMEYGGKDGFIDELYIETDHRGKGYAKTALDFIEKRALSLGVNALHLEVSRHNLRVKILYENFGFIDQDNDLMHKYLKQSKDP